jgi:PAS domain S-box-containing protein
MAGAIVLSFTTKTSSANAGLENFLEMDDLILAVSARLAECQPREIKCIIRDAVYQIGLIEMADQCSWSLLSKTGEFTDIYLSTDDRSSSSSLLQDGLRKLPWCLAQLNAGKPVVLSDIEDLPSSAVSDYQFLSNARIRSIALLPSRTLTPSRGVFTLLSIDSLTDWPIRLGDQCALLGNIFSNAHRQRIAQLRNPGRAAYLQQIFHTSTVGMALIEDGKILFANGAFCATLGYSLRELRTMRYDDIVQPAGRKRWAAYEAKQTLLRKDRSVLEANVTISVLKGSPLEAPLTIVMLEDISDRKRAEHELDRREGEVKALASQILQSQENERKRLSRELHDDIGQRLSLATSTVAMMASRYSEASAISAEKLDSLQNDLNSLCSDVHSMSHNLHSYKLQYLGLRLALKDLGLRLSQAGVRIEVDIEDLCEPQSEEISLCLYRVAQEALSNALKHSNSSVVVLIAAKLENSFYMTIQDCGIGFDTKACVQGLGLISMKERLKLADGELTYDSVPGRGTEIWASVPDACEVVLPRAPETRSGIRIRNVA